MQWSKIKKLTERFLCDSLKNRISLQATVYRKAHDSPARVWLTFDNQEIMSASDMTYNVQHSALYNQLKREQQLQPIPYNADWRVMLQTKERQALAVLSDKVDSMLDEQHIWPSDYVYEALLTYGQLSIEQALQSIHPIIQGYAMLDRRVGKRTLQKLKHTKLHPFVQKCYEIRCQAEFNYVNIERTVI